MPVKEVWHFWRCPSTWYCSYLCLMSLARLPALRKQSSACCAYQPSLQAALCPIATRAVAKSHVVTEAGTKIMGLKQIVIMVSTKIRNFQVKSDPEKMGHQRSSEQVTTKRVCLRKEEDLGCGQRKEKREDREWKFWYHCRRLEGSRCQLKDAGGDELGKVPPSFLAEATSPQCV